MHFFLGCASLHSVDECSCSLTALPQPGERKNLATKAWVSQITEAGNFYPISHMLSRPLYCHSRDIPPKTEGLQLL